MNLDYGLLFQDKEHYLTVPQRNSRKLCFGNKSILKAINHQNEGEDLFITKYPVNHCVSVIILDFDYAENPKVALNDARKLKAFTKHHGLNTVIVSSGSKGYHTYTQIPCWNFGNTEYESPVNNKIWFNKFVELVIGVNPSNRNSMYKTLDWSNLNAGLQGNIRLIGSIHPKTNNRCEIIDGEFVEDIQMKGFEYAYECLTESMKFAEVNVENKEIKRKEFERKVREEYDGENPILENDLRTLMPSIYGGEVKTFEKGYIMMQCPFHNDSNPSMYVDKEKYFCKSCHEKGNWFSLRKKGVVDFKKNEYIRVGEA